jgi:hypothetical protein
MQSNKGVYALLVGSGISRAAKIPTGWEVVLELVRKIALLSGEDCEPDPEAWYSNKFGHAPDYSVLLDQVAKTSAERQQLLRSYFEPTEEEQEEKAKQPTIAHHAIANLVANGYIKVIVTTNFDRLMELALQEAGIAPLVLSTPDQIEGALPLVHTQCCVIKVHGDYLDTRIKNTPAELDTYDPKMDALLDQVFDQFGLVTCGWSADWDVALRKAIERAPSRRFTTYWTSRGAPSEIAAKLIQHRSGQLVSVKDADNFFRSLQEKVDALERFSEPHPLSTKTAVATVKKYLAEDKYRIRLYDLINDEASKVIERLDSSGLLASNGDTSSAALTEKVRRYEAICKPLIAMAATCGQWGSMQTSDIWQRVQQTLYSVTKSGGTVILLEYQRYPLTLVTYAACLGSVLSGNLIFINTLLQNKLKKDSRSDAKAIEILLALSFGKHAGTHAWRPPGCYGYRTGNFELVIGDIKNSIDTFAEDSPYIKSGLFGNSVAECLEQIKALSEFSGQLRWR